MYIFIYYSTSIYRHGARGIQLIHIYKLWSLFDSTTVETRRSTIYVRTSVSVSDSLSFSFQFQLSESVEHAAALTSE